MPPQPEDHEQAATGRPAPLHRQRLHERLSFPPAPGKQFVILHAPAGYGKSTLIHQFLSSLPQGTETHLHRCSPSPAITLWQQLANTLGLNPNSHPSPEITTPPAAQRAQARELVYAWAAQLASPAVLVFEHYERVCQPETDLDLYELTTTSKQLSIIVATRRSSQLGGMLFGHLVEQISAADFAFTSEEVAELATQCGAAETSERDSALARAAGWPLAVTSVLTHARTQPLWPAVDGLDTADPQPLPEQRSAQFAQELAAILPPPAKQLVRSYLHLDALTSVQLAHVLEQPLESVQYTLNLLTEYGVLIPRGTGNLVAYALHPFLAHEFRQPPPEGMPHLLDPPASQWSATELTPTATTTAGETGADATSTEKPMVADTEARGFELRIADSAATLNPAAACALYLEHGDLISAELILARHFTSITDTGAALMPYLEALTETQLGMHPTLAVARLRYAASDPCVPQAALKQLVRIMYHGACARLAEPNPASPLLTLGYRIHEMIGLRLSGNLQQALQRARQLESEHDSQHSANEHTLDREPAYLAEIALTAELAADTALGWRCWNRILTHSTEPSWRIAAHGGLALSAMQDGHFDLTEAEFQRAETLSAAHHTTAPLLHWITAEVARAPLAYERCDVELLRDILTRIAPWKERIELWPVLLLAESELIRLQRGPVWALEKFTSEIRSRPHDPEHIGLWASIFLSYRLMLLTTIGKYGEAQKILDALPKNIASINEERARLAVFTGNYVEALFTLHRIDTTNPRTREIISYNLMTAIAHWNSAKTAEAISTFASAMALVIDTQQTVLLRCLPYQQLMELAAAAAAAGHTDYRPTLEAVPEPARAQAREPLTLTEIRVLEALSLEASSEQIATSLGVAPATVKRHRATIYRKLGVKSRNAALIEAQELGLFSTGADLGTHDEA